MNLYALASGSRGNAFALAARDGVLLLDAGLSARACARRAALAGLDLDRLVGIALTHEHGDHARGAVRLARRHAVPVVATEGTLRALGAATTGVVTHCLRASTAAEIGPFTISSCRVLHDAAEPAALAIEADAVRVGLAYDVGRPTVALRYLLREVDAIIVESNYDEVMLRTSGYPSSVQHRIAGSAGHLSNGAAAMLVSELLHQHLALVVLAHLSQECNDPEVARSTVLARLRACGYRGELIVALQDRPVGPLPLRPGARLRSLQGELELGATVDPAPDRAEPEWNPASVSAAPLAAG